MQSVTNRFIAFYEYLLESKTVKNKKDFYLKIGKSPDSSFLTEILKGRSKVGLEILQSTVLAFPELDCNWALTGNGNMLRNLNENISIAAEEDEPYKNKSEVLILKKLEEITKTLHELQEQKWGGKRTSA